VCFTTTDSPSLATTPDRLASSVAQNPGSVTSDQTRSTGAAISVSRSIRSMSMRTPSIQNPMCNFMVARQRQMCNP
jgi:hypothetical protein